MKAPYRIGLLSSRNHPLLPYFLEEVAREPRVAPFLILDSKDFSEKDVALFAGRTGHAFPKKDIALFLSRWPSVTVTNHNGEDCLRYVRDQSISLLVNAGTPRILQPDILGAPPIGILNVHPGLLPKYRGASCCEWAIYNNDPVGVTAHFMDEGIDSGPILFTERYTIRPGESYQSVRIGLYRLAHQVRVQAVREIFEKDLSPRNLPPQPAADVYKPIPDELLKEVKQRLHEGRYAPVG